MPKCSVSNLPLVLSLLLCWSAWAQTPPDPPRGEVRLVVLSDFNGPYGTVGYNNTVTRVLETIAELWRPDLFLSAGDVVAGQDASLPDERFSEMWAAFDDRIAAHLREAGIPYAFAVGNHDGSSLLRGGEYVFAREREAARDYWTTPMYEGNLDYVNRERFPFDYTFTFGPLFVLVWDASSAVITSEQLLWVEAQLSSPAARAAEGRLVVGHLPLYGVSADKNRAGEILEGGDALREILERHDIHTYISGHHAAYYPGRRGRLELLHTGGIGGRRLLGSPLPPRSTVTVLDVDFGPLRVRDTTFDAVTFRAVDPEGLPERLNGWGGTVTRRDLSVPQRAR